MKSHDYKPEGFVLLRSFSLGFTWMICLLIMSSCAHNKILIPEIPERPPSATEIEKAEMESGMFVHYEEQPQFPGGVFAWKAFLKDNYKYPTEAQSKGIEGRVFLSFEVQKDGTLTDIVVMRGIGGGCNEEAIRILKQSPKWIPGKISGVATKMRMQIQIRFQPN